MLGEGAKVINNLLYNKIQVPIKITLFSTLNPHKLLQNAPTGSILVPLKGGEQGEHFDEKSWSIASFYVHILTIFRHKFNILFHLISLNILEIAVFVLFTLQFLGS